MTVGEFLTYADEITNKIASGFLELDICTVFILCVIFILVFCGIALTNTSYEDL